MTYKTLNLVRPLSYEHFAADLIDHSGEIITTVIPLSNPGRRENCVLEIDRIIQHEDFALVAVSQSTHRNAYEVAIPYSGAVSSALILNQYDSPPWRKTRQYEDLFTLEDNNYDLDGDSLTALTVSLFSDNHAVLCGEREMARDFVRPLRVTRITKSNHLWLIEDTAAEYLLNTKIRRAVGAYFDSNRDKYVVEYKN